MHEGKAGGRSHWVRNVGRRRIAMNLLWLIPESVGGGEEYMVRLLEAFAELSPPDLELALLVNTAMWRAYSDLLKFFPIEVVPVSGRGRAQRVWMEHTRLHRYLQRERFDAIHHSGGTVPLRSSGPVLLTVYDLHYTVMPEHCGPLKRAYLRYMVPRSVRRAHRIITLTDFVADDLAAKLNISHKDILPVPPCIRQAKLADPEECSQVRARYGLNSSAGAPRPFFLYPATTCPH